MIYFFNNEVRDMTYKSLKILSYEDYKTSKTEYERRINNPAAIRTGLIISPYSIQQQRCVSEEHYELFCVLLPEIVKMKDTVFLNRKKLLILSIPCHMQLRIFLLFLSSLKKFRVRMKSKA